MFFVLPLLALSAQLVNAIQFTSPAANATLVQGSTYDLTWSSVNTDPTTFSIYLVNFVNWPPFYTPLQYNVETASGEASVRIPCAVDPSYGFQFNAINGTNVYIIYAQSPKFTITGSTGACTDPPSSTNSVCPPASTATVTVTVSGNSTLVSTTSTSAFVPTGTPANAGRCPSIIGWNGGYGSAVSLTSVPAAGQPLITSAPTSNGNGWGAWAGVTTTTVTRYHTVCPCDV